MANIYELTNEFLQLQEMAESGEFDEQTLKDTFESINLEIEQKAENTARFIKNIQSDIEGIKKEVERLNEKRKYLENLESSLKKNLEFSMIATDKKKFKAGTFSFNIQKNAPALEIEHEFNIPQIYYIPQEPKLDKKALLSALKVGQEVDGVKIKHTESHRIR